MSYQNQVYSLTSCWDIDRIIRLYVPNSQLSENYKALYPIANGNLFSIIWLYVHKTAVRLHRISRKKLLIVNFSLSCSMKRV